MENKTAEEIIEKVIKENITNLNSQITPKEMLLVCKKSMEEHASQQLAEKDKEIDRLKKSLEGLLDGVDTFCKTIPAQMTSEAIYLWEKRTEAHESLNK